MKRSSRTSFSRLCVYEDCPRKYWHQYINKTPHVASIEECFIKGRLAHALIERHLIEGVTMDDALDAYLDEWLKEDCKLDISSVGLNRNLLFTYAKAMGHLLYRCSGAYEGEDPIRNRDGSVPKNPIEYPPTVLSAEMRNKGLGTMRQMLDVKASQLNSSFERMSIANIVALALSYSYGFYLPDWVKKVVAVEYDFESAGEATYIDDENEVQWIGKIDMIVETTDDHIAIIDHKSGAKKPEGIDVHWHAQGCMYIQKYCDQTNDLATYFGIYHMPTGEYVMAEASLSTVEEVVNYYKAVQQRIKSCGTDVNQFPKGSLPGKDFGPCVKRDYRTGVVTRVCPFIRECWPSYAEEIESELTNLIGSATDLRADSVN